MNLEIKTSGSAGHRTMVGSLGVRMEVEPIISLYIVEGVTEDRGHKTDQRLTAINS